MGADFTAPVFLVSAGRFAHRLLPFRPAAQRPDKPDTQVHVPGAHPAFDRMAGYTTDPVINNQNTWREIMKKQNQTALTTLTRDDVARVAGAGIGPIVTKVPRAQDMYGNTLSHEEWMDRKLDTTKNPHDFYNGGFDPDKPHIWG